MKDFRQLKVWEKAHHLALYELTLAHELQFLPKNRFEALQSEAEEVKKMLVPLLKTLRANH